MNNLNQMEQQPIEIISCLITCCTDFYIAVLNESTEVQTLSAVQFMLYAWNNYTVSYIVS